MATGKEMCETIVKADFLRKPDGTAPTASEIWNYSSTGELFMVFQWYEQAKICLTMLAPDKGQAEVVKDNLGSAPCG